MSFIAAFVWNGGPANTGLTLLAAVANADGSLAQKDLTVAETAAGSGCYKIFPTLADGQRGTLVMYATALGGGTTLPGSGRVKAEFAIDAELENSGQPATLADSERVYWSEHDVEFDDNSGTDEHNVRFMRDAAPQAATTPKITVKLRSDHSTLINNEDLTLITGTNTYKYDASGAERLPPGDSGIVLLSGTIDGSPRTSEHDYVRDVAA